VHQRVVRENALVVPAHSRAVAEVRTYCRYSSVNHPLPRAAAAITAHAIQTMPLYRIVRCECPDRSIEASTKGLFTKRSVALAIPEKVNIKEIACSHTRANVLIANSSRNAL